MFYIYITIYSLNEEQYWIQQEKDRQYRSEPPSSIPGRLRMSSIWLRCSSCTNFILFYFIDCVSKTLTPFFFFFRQGSDHPVVTKHLAQPNPHPAYLSSSSYGNHVNIWFHASHFVFLWSIRPEKVSQGPIHPLHCLLKQTSVPNSSTKVVKQNNI